MIELKQSTARYVNIGPFLDVTDAATNETGLAGTMTVYLSKVGGARAARNSSTAISYDRDGAYRIHLDATDTDTLGDLVLSVSDPATHLHVEREFEIVTANWYDSKYSTDELDVNIVQVTGTAVTDVDDFKNGASDLVTLAAATHTGAIIPTVTTVTATTDVTNPVTIGAMNAAGAADFSTVDSGETVPVAGSVCELAQGSAGGNVTVGGFTQAALGEMANTDSGETTAVTGSVAKLAQGAAGGNVTVEDFTQAGLAKMANTDTGETVGVSGSVVALASNSVAGSGAVSTPITVTDSLSNPIDGAEVWITSDTAGNNTIAGTLTTDAAGLATFMLDAGTYYVWLQKSGHNFGTLPKTLTVTA